MDVCETATTALENLEQLRIEQPELPTIVHLTAGNAIQMKTTLDRNDVELQGGSEIAATFQPQVSDEKCTEWPDRIILLSEKESAEKCLEVASDVGNIETQPDQPCGDEEMPDECQSEPLQQQEQRLPIIPNLPLDSDKTDILPLTPVATDDSLSSDDAIADSLQCSNPEWLVCQASARRLSSISSTSVSSSTATISPSDTLAGASITDESLSSDETAQDLSQNSLESTKYQSDLESVSVSSIVQKAMPCATNEDIEDLSKRRVSFPMKDSDLVTGYLEPANPWETATVITTNNELINLYKESCLKHNTAPLEYVVLHLKTIDLEKPVRQDRLSLRGIDLAPEACESLEEILKRVQYQTIDLTCCSLNDSTASAMFDMIEFYESAVEVDVSDNPSISTAGWQSCNSMIRKSRDLRSVTIRGNPLSETHSSNLGKALNISNLHTLKLEHCGLTGRPLGSLCNQLRNNKTLRELWLAYNDLYCRDAEKLAELLKANHNIQFLDVSNNNLKDAGVKSIAVALIQQSADLSIAAKILQSQLKLKAIEMKKAAFTETTRNSQQDGSSETSDTNETTNRSSANGSRSMLDQLLQLHPGECKEPVQAASLTSNNNVSNDESGEIEESFVPNELDPCNEKAVCVKTENPLEQGEVSENVIGDDVQIIISNDINLEIIRPQTDDEKIAANNNILKDASCDIPLLESTEAAKPYDLNENKGSLNDESLLINTIDDSPSFKTSVSLSPNNSSSPIIFERPSSAEGFERREDQEDTAYTTRSQSNDSLSSDNSLDAMDTHLSAEIKEKITKNDTLGRQQKLNQNNESLTDNNSKPPRGLQALILWNNNLTRSCSEYIADMIGSTNSLEILNIGKNTLSNEFIHKISNNLKCNRTLTTLGLQSSHLNSKGIEKLAEILQFGGNSTLERIDIRDNNVQVDGLIALCDALKSNKSIMQIDIDDEPKRILDDGDGHFHYSKHLQAVRSLFAKNQSTYEIPKMRNSRKISLTCQSFHSPVVNISLRNETLDVKKKAGAKLRSPLPSPPTGSPSSSPVPSRFQVSRVSENIKCISSPSHLNSMPVPPVRSSPSPTSRFRVTMVKTDDYMARKDKLPEKVMITTSTSTDSLGTNSNSANNSTSDIQFVFPEVTKTKIVPDNDKSNIVSDKIKIPKIIQSEAKVIQQQSSVTANTSPKMVIKSPLLSLFEPLPQMTRETPHMESSQCASIDESSKESDVVEIISKKALVIDAPSEDLSKYIEVGLVEDPAEKVINEQVQVPVALTIESKVEKPVFDQLSELVADNPHANPTAFTDTTPPIDPSDITIFVDVDAEREASLPMETKPKPPNESEQRVRKTSWNANATVEKICSFLNPANMFHRSNSNESDTKSVSSSESHESQTQEPNVNPSKAQYLFDVALKELKDFSKAIKQNITPIQSIQQSLPAPPAPLPQFLSSGHEESPSTIVTANPTTLPSQQDSCDLSPTHINIEIKENISPHAQQNPPSFSSCDDIGNANKPLKSDNASQAAVDLGDIPKVNQPFAATQGNEIHDS